MKAMGCKPGFPDLVMPVPHGTYIGLAIEMKTATGRLSAEQTEWLELFDAAGWQARICRSADEAREAIMAYLDVRQAPPLP